MHLMLDLETLDTSPSAIIVSIGAVLFDPYNDAAPAERFYRVVNMHDQLKRGRTASVSTIAWWMEQSEAARDVFKQDAVRLDDALADFNLLAERAQGVWGNGSDFDNTIVMHANNMYGLSGWRYSRNRCYRTLKAIGTGASVNLPAREGTHHDALDDALYQAMCMQVIVKQTGLAL